MVADMRMLGLLSVVLALLIVAWLAKGQGAALAPMVQPRAQSPQQAQQQVRQSLDAALQRPQRPMPDE